jgi:ribokinase
MSIEAGLGTRRRWLRLAMVSESDLNDRVGICVVGSINVDILIEVEAFAQPNETVIGKRDFTLSQGGKGANQAAAAAAAGAHVHMIARVGNDDWGREAIRHLEDAGVDCTHVDITPNATTGLAAIMVDAGGNNMITVASGANMLLSPDDVMRAQAVIASSRVLVLQLEVPTETVEAAIAVARSHDVMVVLNPAPAPREPLRGLDGVNVMVPNEHEAAGLARLHGSADATDTAAATALIAAGVQHIVVTEGARGCRIFDADGATRIAPFRVDAVDTTGAGDVFCGFLAFALATNRSIREAAVEASAAAAISVTRAQARRQLPCRDEVRELMKQQSRLEMECEEAADRSPA